MSNLSQFFGPPRKRVNVKVYLVAGGGGGLYYYERTVSGFSRFNDNYWVGVGGGGAVYIGDIETEPNQQFSYTLGERGLDSTDPTVMGTKGGSSTLTFNNSFTIDGTNQIYVPGGGCATANGSGNPLIDGGCGGFSLRYIVRDVEQNDSEVDFLSRRFGRSNVPGMPVSISLSPQSTTQDDRGNVDYVRNIPVDNFAISHKVVGGSVNGLTVDKVVWTEGPSNKNQNDRRLIKNLTKTWALSGVNTIITLEGDIVNNTSPHPPLVYSPSNKYPGFPNARLRGKGSEYGLPFDDSNFTNNPRDYMTGPATGGAILFAYPSSYGFGTFGSDPSYVTTTTTNNPSNNMIVMEQAITSGDTNFSGTFTFPDF